MAARISSRVAVRSDRMSALNSCGRSRMMARISDAILPASARSSSAFSSRACAMLAIFSSAGGGNTSRSIFDRYVGVIPTDSANSRRPKRLASRRARMRGPKRSDRSAEPAPRFVSGDDNVAVVIDGRAVGQSTRQHHGSQDDSAYDLAEPSDETAVVVR
jgi:hypothetical protein